MSDTKTDLTRMLGSFPMTYSAGAERWVSETLSVELDGVEWGVHLSIANTKPIGFVHVYVFNNAGDNVHSDSTFSPVLSLLTALRSTLR